MACFVVKGSSSVKNSVPVNPPSVTPPVPIPSIVQHKNSGGTTNKSLAPIDPLLPSSSGMPPPPTHLSNPPKETKYIWVKKGTTTYEGPEDFRTLIKKEIIPGVLKKPSLRRQFEEDAKIKIVSDHVKGSSEKDSVPVKPPCITPKPILLPSVPVPSVVEHKNSGGGTSMSLAPIDPLLPSSSGMPPPPSHLSNPPKETEYVWVKKVTTTYEVPENFRNLIKKEIIPGVLKKPSLRRQFEEDAKIKIVSDHVKGSSEKDSVPVKPPCITPKPILLPSVPVPSVVEHKNSGGGTSKSLAPIDPLLPSSSGMPPPPSHLSNPPKETEYVWVKKVTTTYEVPEDFRNLIKRDIIPGVLKKPLTSLTYRNYFAALLYAEDYYMEKWSKYVLSDVNLELYKVVSKNKNKKMNKTKTKNKSKKPIANDNREEKYFVAFEIDQVPEKRPFLLSRDFVLVKPAGKENAKPFKGSLRRVVKGNRVLAEFGVDFFSWHSPELKYDVSFSFNRVCLKRSHQAVEVAMDPLFQFFLFPNQDSRICDLNPPYLITSNRYVDHAQALAIYHISRIKNPPPYLIQGPLCVTRGKLSRTGLVIQQAVLRICEESPSCRILINASTNNTCDVLLRSLIMEGIPMSDMFRANAAFREFDKVPSDILPLCTLQEDCFTCPSLQELKSFKVILSTFVSSFRLHNEGIIGGHFSHIFLVDASSASEPETIISLANLADPKTVVVVSGTSRKRPTRIRSSIAKENGLACSYFERLFGSEPYCSRDPTFVTCIDTIG